MAINGVTQVLTLWKESRWVIGKDKAYHHSIIIFFSFYKEEGEKNVRGHSIFPYPNSVVHAGLSIANRLFFVLSYLRND